MEGDDAGRESSNFVERQSDSYADDGISDPRNEPTRTARRDPYDAQNAQDPRNVFLDAKAVMMRYGWGKTKGYQHLRDRQTIPPPVLTRPDRWRLDQLQRWEERRIEQAEIESTDLPSSPPKTLADRLPSPKVSRRKSA